MPFLQDVRVSRASKRSQVATYIKSLVGSRRAPRNTDFAPLLTQDTVGFALEILEPGNLAKIISHSLQGLLPYRLARHFEAVQINAGLIDVADLRKLKTAQSRLALAALSALPWSSASPAERRVIVTCGLLRRIAAGDVTL